jgi:hypothetical protein
MRLDTAWAAGTATVAESSASGLADGRVDGVRLNAAAKTAKTEIFSYHLLNSILYLIAYAINIPPRALFFCSMFSALF